MSSKCDITFESVKHVPYYHCTIQDHKIWLPCVESDAACIEQSNIAQHLRPLFMTCHIHFDITDF